MDWTERVDISRDSVINQLQPVQSSYSQRWIKPPCKQRGNIANMFKQRGEFQEGLGFAGRDFQEGLGFAENRGRDFHEGLGFAEMNQMEMVEMEGLGFV